MKLENRIQWLRDNAGNAERVDGVHNYKFFRATVSGVERYEIDFSMTAGWLQYDTSQDASYFGIWVNPETLQTLSFAEGDYLFCEHRTPESFNAEIEHMNDFYDTGFIAKAICPETGEMTVYEQNRAEFMAQGAN